MLLRKDLKPGQRVRNRVSNRVGTLTADSAKTDELQEAHEFFAFVRMEPKNKGERSRRVPWLLEHCELITDD